MRLKPGDIVTLNEGKEFTFVWMPYHLRTTERFAPQDIIYPGDVAMVLAKSGKGDAYSLVMLSSQTIGEVNDEFMRNV